MKFVSYPTARDRQNRERGRVLTGDVVSQAPPSGQWVYVAEKRKYYRVFGPPGHPAGKEQVRSAIDTEAHEVKEPQR